MSSAIRFYAGEKKYIDITVVPKNQNDTVVISSALYELYKNDSVVESGECEAEGRNLKILLGIDTDGTYTLKITVAIGAETFIQKATIWVEK